MIGVPGVIHTYDLNKNCIIHSSELIIKENEREEGKKLFYCIFECVTSL